MKLSIAAQPLIRFTWLISLWAVIFLLLLSLVAAWLRKRARALVEKAARASDPYRNAERVIVDAETVAGLPQEELKRLTDQFESLGFEKVRDYQLRVPGATSLIGFGRTLVNRKLLCFGEIMATPKVLETGGGLNFGLDSYLEDGWALGAVNRGPNTAEYLQRLPKNPQLRIPGATPSELLRLHLDQRNKLARDLQLKVLTDLSLETRNRKVSELLALRREAMLSRDSMTELQEARRVQQAGQWEWLGDYLDEMTRRRRGPMLRPLSELSPTYSVPQDDALEQMKKADEEEEGEKSQG